jgi:hypothetical protein
MIRACPISHQTLDERAARLCALLVLVPLGLALVTGSPWPALLLAVDFGLRGFGARRLSPLAQLARRLTERLRLRPRPTNAGPKAFAAKLGMGFSLAVTVSLLLGSATMALAWAAPFAACALLEGAVGFCVGCRLYPGWQLVRSRAGGGAPITRRAPAPPQ